jgi:hypothetical protein
VLVEAQPWLGRREHALKRCLPLGQRFAPHVGPVELDQVECPHENAVVSIPSPDQLKTQAIPSSLQATASPSMMQDRERSSRAPGQSAESGRLGHCRAAAPLANVELY